MRKSNYYSCPYKKGSPFLHIEVHELCMQNNPRCEVYSKNIGKLPAELRHYVQLVFEDQEAMIATSDEVSLPSVHCGDME